MKLWNTGVALVVFPGGGFEVVAIDLEGIEACDWPRRPRVGAAAATLSRLQLGLARLRNG